MLNAKLCHLKNALQQWNKNSVGNVFQNIQKAEKILEATECRMETYDSFEAWAALDRAKCSLQYYLSLEELYWKQKFRVRWQQEGDQNIQFFRSVVKQRRSQAIIRRIKNHHDQWIDSEAEIGKEATHFF